MSRNRRHWPSSDPVRPTFCTSEQDDETFQSVPGSEFVITRVAFRDNSSKYYINERPSTFTEVGKTLRAKGVDLDNNRFLILQVYKLHPQAEGR